MTDLELKEEYRLKLEEKFKKLSPYSYGSSDWISIEEKLSELKAKVDEIPFTDLKEIRIDGEDYLIEFDEFINKIQTLSVNMTSREVVLKKLREFNSKVASVFMMIWRKIRFIFSIPALAFSSFVLSYMTILLFSLPLNLIFPAGFSDEYSGLAESIIAAIIFIVLKVLLTLDAHDRYLEENWIVYIIKYLCSVGVWWTTFYLIRYTTFETIYQFNYAQWAFYLPFFWLAGIKHEFFMMGIIGFLVVTIAPIIISLPIILVREFGINDTNKKNIEYKSKEELESEDYNYRFNPDVEISSLGKKNDNDQLINQDDYKVDYQFDTQEDDKSDDK